MTILLTVMPRIAAALRIQLNQTVRGLWFLRIAIWRMTRH